MQRRKERHETAIMSEASRHGVSVARRWEEWRRYGGMKAGGGVQGEKRVGIAEQACRRAVSRACMRGGGMEEVEHAPAVVGCLRLARGAGGRRRAEAGLAWVWG